MFLWRLLMFRMANPRVLEYEIYRILIWKKEEEGFQLLWFKSLESLKELIFGLHVAIFGLISHNALHKAHIGLQTHMYWFERDILGSCSTRGWEHCWGWWCTSCTYCSFAQGPLDQYHQLYEILMRMEARMDFDQAHIDYCFRCLDAWFNKVERKLDIDHPADLDNDSWSLCHSLQKGGDFLGLWLDIEGEMHMFRGRVSHD